jgi:hypothetical protein
LLGDRLRAAADAFTGRHPGAIVEPRRRWCNVFPDNPHGAVDSEELADEIWEDESPAAASTQEPTE